MRIIIDILDYRGEPMEGKHWCWAKDDGRVSELLEEGILKSLRSFDVPTPNTITVTWEESK